MARGTVELRNASQSAEIRFEVLEGYDSTGTWLDEVCKASDAHRNELGFLARSIFEQFARRDGLYVLLAQTSAGQQYAGHLLFDRHFPRAHVRQMFVLEPFRRFGAASQLLDHLRHSLTQSCFISIYARVAEDLTSANAFWHKQRFYVQRSEKGGVTRNRQILVRCHELDSPQLFPASGVNDHNPLGLVEPAANELPMYLLDMNVLFDVQPRRLRRTEVVGLFQAERMNFCRLAISSEIRDELQRNLQSRHTDPMEAYIETFPCLPVDQPDEADGIFSKLATLIFPQAAGHRPLTANERSDIRHVITAIQHDLAGIITNDAAMLAVAPEIEQVYGVQVLSSGAFELEESAARSDEAFETAEKDTLRLLSVTTDAEPAVRAFLSQKMHLSGSAIATNWLPIETQGGRIAFRCAVWSGSACIGYVTWPAIVAPDSMTIARAAVDESHPQAIGAARILLKHLVDRLSSTGPRQLKLEVPPNQSHLREVGSVLGFVGSPQGHHFVKSALGQVLTQATWSAGQAALAAKGGPRLPAQAPTYNGPDQQLIAHTPDGNRVHVSLDRLESLLAPTLFCLPGRPAIITPVRRVYAEPLLGHSRQASLLPQTSASLYADRIYLSQPSTLKHFKRGTLMFFYESGKDGGRSQVVAVGRVREAYLRACDALDVSDLQQSVLTTTNLTDIGRSAMKTVTIFDNIFPLPNPVDLKVLKRLGCGRPNDLITTHAISDEQLQAILSEGFGRG
ncbi:hypothetical protein DyAD56_02890 [Dyella sp. AD56]|jgi:GNAT superfamily N-acetyltransferase|nr:hypothetical protein DyAD56_02890 [Dyella sp. AD56]